jgi:type IV secretion system protein VirB5
MTTTPESITPFSNQASNSDLSHSSRMGRKTTDKRNAGANTNPYTEARREWNERYGDYISQARNWRISAIISGLIALAAVLGLIYIGAQNKVVPYVVQVDKNGAAIAVGPGDKAQAVDERVIKAYLARFISDMRSVSPDQVAGKAAIERVYAMISNTTPALTKLNEYFKANNPFELAENTMVAVEVSSVLPITGQTWQIEWNEVARDKRGELIRSMRMRASVTVEISPPKEERLLLINPLGIYVTDLNWVQSLQ